MIEISNSSLLLSIDSLSADYSYLLNTPGAVPAPPVESRAQFLPFDQLDWRIFETLCLRLARLEERVLFCRIYGTQGDGQEGIDIYARAPEESKFKVFQCKNEQDWV